MCQMHFSRKQRHGSPFAKSRRSPGEAQALLQYAAQATTDECIILDWKKRPAVKYRGRSMNASRVVWIEATGEDPGEDFVLHTCHRGDDGCINIRHLYLGDHDRNMLDMVEAGRSQAGEANINARLTEPLADEIRRRYIPRDPFGNSGAALAAEFGVSPMTVSRVVNDLTWSENRSTVREKA